VEKWEHNRAEIGPVSLPKVIAFIGCAGDGRFELYKTMAKFEGPPGREQHGFPSEKEM
jgi:hypothetical protein